MTTLFGIPNCGTIKKARAWLDERGIDYVFHDYKKAGIDESMLRAWVAELGWEQLINKRGQMWRKLEPAVRDNLDEEAAIRVMLQTPGIIRRPVLDTGSARYVGFTEDQYEAIFTT
jgi:Spx/MgsR family transcriptional regulator